MSAANGDMKAAVEQLTRMVEVPACAPWRHSFATAYESAANSAQNDIRPRARTRSLRMPRAGAGRLEAQRSNQVCLPAMLCACWEVLRAGGARAVCTLRSLCCSIAHLTDPVSDPGKDYDPTAAAREERERRERRHKAAMEKKEQKELEACTFKPTVSRRSMELLQTVQKDRPSLHSPVRTPSRMSYKGEEVKGKPEISEVSRALVAGKDRQGPIYERLLSEGAKQKSQRELLAEQHAKQEAESVVGVPQINEQSAALVKSKRTDQAATVGPMLFSPASGG
jgi:hypothetical protein